jgi:hypothetical protein
MSNQKSPILLISEEECATLTKQLQALKPEEQLTFIENNKNVIQECAQLPTSLAGGGSCNIPCNVRTFQGGKKSMGAVTPDKNKYTDHGEMPENSCGVRASNQSGWWYPRIFGHVNGHCLEYSREGSWGKADLLCGSCGDKVTSNGTR